MLVKDACGSGTVAMHRTGILNLANRLYGGAVADAESVSSLIAGARVKVWVPDRPAAILYDYDDADTLYEAL